MTATQIKAREDFCRRVLDLSDENFFQINKYLDDMFPHIMSSHIPNAETAAAIEELRAGKGRATHSMEELMAALHDENDN